MGLFTMQLPVLLYVSLMQILLSQAKGGRWEIHVNQTINTTKGKDVIIHCRFDSPPEQMENVKVYWKTKGKSECSNKDKDKHAFVFHHDTFCIDPQFRNRTKLISEGSKGDCSLKLFNISESELNMYVRVRGFNDSYSFYQYTVKINSDGQNLGSLSHTDANFVTATMMPVPLLYKKGNIKLYLAIFVPLLGLLVIAAGIFTFKICKRSRMLNREESEYYENFRRTSSTPPKSEPFCKTSNKMHPDAKVIDEPVYINLQASANQTDRQVGRSVDNIYGNVDYTA